LQWPRRMDITREITNCHKEYQALSVAFRTNVTFKEFFTIKHPEWDDDLFPHLVVEKKRKEIKQGLSSTNILQDSQRNQEE
jgi:hypothetical protein